jgi:hypothetical protein
MVVRKYKEHLIGLVNTHPWYHMNCYGDADGDIVPGVFSFGKDPVCGAGRE